ncbi:hypothetical protein G6O67_008855 [Ophiocordyceps sinensis]|uniref:DUF155 domain-containing protein n=1 Tax=Ophiocordyceps sinensis TaxID=72228 RepID=A0A8H4LQM6_9HYPO|nr:hypothetical protein G6O67_008855 [Ophiocordyceps sinensis]
MIQHRLDPPVCFLRKNGPIRRLLLPTPAPSADNRHKNPRTVTFSPDPVTYTIEIEPEPHPCPSSCLAAPGPGTAVAPPALAALNNKIRRRYSHGAAPHWPCRPPKIGASEEHQKTEKLKLLPNPDLEDGRGRGERAATGSPGRGKARGRQPNKLIDEMHIHPLTPYTKPAQAAQPPSLSTQPRRHSTGGGTFDDDAQRQATRADPGDVSAHDSGYGDVFAADGAHHDANARRSLSSDQGLLLSSVAEEVPVHAPDNLPDFDVQVHTPEVFLFDYGVIVVWGMLESQEARFLRDIAKFEVEKLAPDDVETEQFNFYYTREYQARIYNDFITLRDKHNYMSKLAISHALAQSVKTSLFEELIASSTVDTCKDIPTQIALTGKIDLSRSQINMQIGELFILRINIHLNGSVLDTPELFWVEPQLKPVYQAVRSYLEMDQRVELVTERLDVIADLLAVLKDQLSHGHDEKLEWIVIVLIAMEILIAAINIIVDLYAGV